jgi:hypothetical protein
MREFAAIKRLDWGHRVSLWGCIQAIW